ncbi:MAG: hypothetical protein IJ466_02580, partial [Clostridia bacterium]|nr:hypothetical protein [Clostridia bacterium]
MQLILACFSKPGFTIPDYVKPTPAAPEKLQKRARIVFQFTTNHCSQFYNPALNLSHLLYLLSQKRKRFRFSPANRQRNTAPEHQLRGNLYLRLPTSIFIFIRL